MGLGLSKMHSLGGTWYIYFRFIYVRNAAGLVKDKAKLLHMGIMIFCVSWHFNRICMRVVAPMWKGFNFEQKPPGKYCMKTNLNSTWHGGMDFDFSQRATSNRLLVLVSMGLYTIALIYFCLGALIAR